ncbi:MAG: GGDEF domain-containing protein [Deltaproteobacteria bacterium]|nr:GGDEF domain-containing protein [Deltaproteobacteria bacterium]
MRLAKNTRPPDTAVDNQKQFRRPDPSATPEHCSIARMMEILKKNGTLTACIESADTVEPELFVVVADRLSPEERKVLKQAADIVVSSGDELAKKVARLEQENRRLRSLSLTDGLTGLYNYRFFVRQLEIEMARSRRSGQPCSLVMIDLDNFKQINDTLGHDEGNRYLVSVAQTILDKLRPTDICCRYGGDEFAVIMTATYLFDAKRIAERLREALAQMPSPHGIACSASLGLAEYDPSSGNETHSLVKAADKALYKAKKAGKNRICLEGPRLGATRDTAAVTPDEKAALLSNEKGGQHR